MEKTVKCKALCFFDIPESYEKKEEDGENCQMQSVSLFKETQKVNVKMINGFQIKIKYIRISQTSFVLVWCLLHF